MEALGWHEARRHGIAIVEWPERMDGIDPPYHDVTISFTGDEQKREIAVEIAS